MTFSVAYKVLKDGKVTHTGRVKTEAEDKEDAKHEFHHSLYPAVPEGSTLKIDYRTIKEEDEQSAS